jgi:O-antigen/teichoic acid export membrane protein
MGKISLVQLVRNAGALLASDLSTRIATYIIYALVARQLGSQDFGRLSLGLTLLYSFQMLASVGVRQLITREVAKDRAQTRKSLSSSTVLVVGMSLFAMLTMSLVGFALQYAAETHLILALLSLNLLPVALSTIFEAIFAGWERMHYTLWATAPVNVLRIGLIGFALIQGLALPGVAIAMVTSSVVLAGAELVLLQRILRATSRAISPANHTTNRGLVTSMAKQSFAFLGIEFVIATTASIQYLVISKLADETSLGLFNAATQVIAPVIMLVLTLSNSLLPVLSRKSQQGMDDMSRSVVKILQFKLALMLPLVIGMFYVCEPVFQLLYGRPEFVLASPLLRITVWGSVCIVFTSVLGQALIVGMREKQVLKMVLALSVTEILMNVGLLTWLGIQGAALAMLITKVAYLALHIYLVKSMLPEISLKQAIVPTFSAALVMALTLAGLHLAGVSTYVSLGVALAVYAGCSVILYWDAVKRSLGWLNTSRSKFLRPRPLNLK